MNDRLMKLSVNLNTYYRKQKDRNNLKHPIRIKHFLEDLSIISNLIEDSQRTKRFGRWANKPLKRMFELKMKKEKKENE